MGWTYRTTLLSVALSFVIGAQQATGQIPNIGNVAKALSNPPDPKKIEEAVKGANPKDVVQAVGSGVVEGQKKVSEASEQATAAMQAGQAALATAAPETTTLALTTTVAAAGDHPTDHLAKAVEGTHIAKIGDDVLNGGIAGVLNGNLGKVTEAISSAKPAEVASKLSEDTQKIANGLSAARPKDVVQEVSRPGQSGTNAGEVMGALQSHASQKAGQLLGGKSAADIARQIGNTSPQDLPDITPNEAVQAAHDSIGGAGSGSQANVAKYGHPIKDGETDPGEEGSGIPFAFILFLGLGMCLGGGWYTFNYLTRPKRTGLPMLDAELGEGDSVQMMHSGPSWGGGGHARDFGGPSAPGFQRF